MSGKIGITPARGFDSLSFEPTKMETSCITPARGFESEVVLRAVSDYWGLPPHGVEPSCVLFSGRLLI